MGILNGVAFFCDNQPENWCNLPGACSVRDAKRPPAGGVYNQRGNTIRDNMKISN